MRKNDNQTIKDILTKGGVPFAIWAIGVAVVILNVWLTSQLAPLAQDIAIIKQAQAREISEATNYASKDDVKFQYDAINSRLVRIENKLDYYQSK